MCLLRGKSRTLYVIQVNAIFGMTMPWLRRFVVGPSSLTPEFNPSSVHVRFVMDQLAMRQVFLRVLHCSPLNIISSFLRTPLHVAFTRKKKPENPGMITKNVCFPEVGSVGQESTFSFFVR
jgi:hypothetical protein